MNKISNKISQRYRMHKVNLCTSCKGSGKLMGMGMMQEVCHACNGDGSLDSKEDKEIIPSSVSDAHEEGEPIRKKRGRPFAVKSE